MHHDSVQPFGPGLSFAFEAPADQGTGGQGDSGAPGVFDSYIATVPEDGREAVTAYLKDAEKNVNTRLEEANQLKKDWGGYGEHLADYREQYKPEDLAAILAWHQQVTQDDNSYQEWLTAAAKERGLIEEGAPPVEEGDLTKDQIAELVSQQATAQIQPLQQRLEAWEQEQMTEQEGQQINTELTRLETDSKLQLTKEQKAVVLELGWASPEGQSDDPQAKWVQAGFDRFREITAEGGRLFVERAQSGPAAPLAAGGVPNAKPVTTFEEAGKMARERLRQNQ
jgi:hypothetical protein